jgi:hypothetical protein
MSGSDIETPVLPEIDITSFSLATFSFKRVIVVAGGSTRQADLRARVSHRERNKLVARSDAHPSR